MEKRRDSWFLISQFYRTIKCDKIMRRWLLVFYQIRNTNRAEKTTTESITNLVAYVAYCLANLIG